MVEIIGGLVELVVRLWYWATDRPPSRQSVSRTIEELNAANARIRSDEMRRQPKQESAR